MFDSYSISSSEADYYADGYRLNSRVNERQKYGAVYDVFSLVYDLNERSDIGVTGAAVVDRLISDGMTHSVPEILAGSETVRLPGYEASDYAQ